MEGNKVPYIHLTARRLDRKFGDGNYQSELTLDEQRPVMSPMSSKERYRLTIPLSRPAHEPIIGGSAKESIIMDEGGSNTLDQFGLRERVVQTKREKKRSSQGQKRKIAYRFFNGLGVVTLGEKATKFRLGELSRGEMPSERSQELRVIKKIDCGNDIVDTVDLSDNHNNSCMTGGWRRRLWRRGQLPLWPRLYARRSVRPMRLLRVRVPVGTRAFRSFRMRGRNAAKLGAGLASLAAAAVLLAAFIGSRSTEAPEGHASGAGAGLPAVPAVAAQPGMAHTAVAVPPAVALPAAVAGAGELPPVRVYLTRSGTIETLPIEQYVLGVLAAEMPAEFDIEALKAQAIAARTFIVRRLIERDRSGVPVQGADVVDTVEHQAYLDTKELQRWESIGKSTELAKLRQAVEETAGVVMTYEGKPIAAAFFSSSGGYTENSEEYWSLKLPYLRSVPSPWEKQINPAFEETITMPVQEMYAKLGLIEAVPATAASMTDSEVQGQSELQAQLAAQPETQLIKILSYTTGQKIDQIKIANQRFTGREVREKLGLRSSQFNIKLDGDQVLITTYGYGHGVGMSQWGANGMAKHGYTATQILQHYYTGISFVHASEFWKH